MGLHRFILRRVLLIFPLLLGITLISFTLTQLAPANAVTANLGEQAAADPIAVAAFRRYWGLDRPLHEQYGTYVWNLLHGDFGVSISSKRPVLQDLKQFFPATVELAVTALAFSVLLAVPLGLLSAARRDTLLDQFTRVISLIGVSVPVFWLGLVAILVFYAGLGWAPPPGRLSADIVPPPFVTGFLVLDGLFAGRTDVVTDALRHLVLPAIVLSSYGLGVITRMMRGSMLEVLAEDYIRTATAKGLASRTVLMRHAARNGLIPVLTVIGLSFGGLLSGAVVTESVFAWPGLGLYAFRSATSFDSPAIMGVGIVIAMIYLLVNLCVDVLYGFADPRIRTA